MKYLGLISLIVFLAKFNSTIVRLNRRQCLTVVSDAKAVCSNVKLIKYKAELLNLVFIIILYILQLVHLLFLSSCHFLKFNGFCKILTQTVELSYLLQLRLFKLTFVYKGTSLQRRIRLKLPHLNSSSFV